MLIFFLVREITSIDFKRKIPHYIQLINTFKLPLIQPSVLCPLHSTGLLHYVYYFFNVVFQA